MSCTVSDESRAPKHKIEFRIVWQFFVLRHSKLTWEFTTLFPNYRQILITQTFTEIDLLKFLDLEWVQNFYP